MTNEVEYIVKETWLPNGVKTEKVGELVRCKNCVFFDPTDQLARAMPDVRRCELLMTAMPEDGYCSYGRRKEKDDGDTE